MANGTISRSPPTILQGIECIKNTFLCLIKLIIGEKVPIPRVKSIQIVSFFVIIFIVKTILRSDAFKIQSAMVSRSAPVCEQDPVFLAIVPSIISVNSATVYIIKNKTEISLKKSNKTSAKTIREEVRMLAIYFIFFSFTLNPKNIV